MVKYFELSDFLYNLIGFAPLIGAEDNKVVVRAMKVTSWKRFLTYVAFVFAASAFTKVVTRASTERNLYFLSN